MKRRRFTEEQIIAVLREHEAGREGGRSGPQHGVLRGDAVTGRRSMAGWRCLTPATLKALEEENARLKKLHADQMLEASALRELLSKKW